ncbi:MAG TPA: putative Ig domain-containing protein [Holophaga sp.]|nr:putative Ig domain-containing protein [Holophaga sp.]
MVAISLAGRWWRAAAAVGLAFLVGCGGAQDGAGPKGNPPSGLVYATAKLSGTVGLPVSPDVPSVTGTVTLYSVTPSLPSGLSLAPATGVVSGTPTAASPLATYTVKAQNSHGSTTASLAILITAAGSPPSGLSYAYPVLSGTVGVALPADAPTVTGAVTAYSVQPAFPPGITLDPATGVITGTPTAAADLAAHVVTATNPYGSTTATVQVQVATAAASKRLLLIQGVPPTSDVVLAKRANLEASPFDGLVFAPKAGRLVFRTTAYTASSLAADAAAIPQINSARLTDNFLLMRGGLDTGFDPFSDAHWTTALANVTAFAQLAKAGNLAGIAFDPEGYTNLGQTSFFDYRAYDQTAHTFQACQANARLRGQQFMRALQEGYPGSNLMFFGALCLLRNGTTQFASASTFPSHPYGLMPDFLDGILDVASPGMTLTDGFEATYTFYRSAWYGFLRDLVLGRGATLLDPSLATRYAAQVRTGMAIYLDATFDLYGNAGYLSHWLAASDRPRFLGYQAWWCLTDTARTAWVYSETADWVNRAGIPAGAEAALLDAKSRVAQGQALGMDLDPVLQAAAAAGGLEW